MIRLIKNQPRDEQHTMSDLEQLGYAVQCMLMQPRYSLFYIKALQLWTIPAIQHRQIRFFFDHMGNVLGYITWAFPSEETLQRFVNDENFLFHVTEWDEDGAPLIVDFCCKPGSAHICLANFKEFGIGDHEKFFWRARRGAPRLLVWSKKESFMAST